MYPVLFHFCADVWFISLLWFVFCVKVVLGDSWT